jgi:hypothetical protein
MPYGRDIEVPSIWDYIAQGLGAGVEGYRGAQRRGDVLDAQKREEDFRKWQALMQLHQQGTLPEDQNKALSDLTQKVTGAPIAIGPSPAQVKAKLALSPAQGFATPQAVLPGGTLLPSIKVQGTEGVPGRQFKFAGLQTPEEEKATTLELGAESALNQARIRVASGQGLPEDYAALNVKSPEQIRLDRITQLQPILDNAAQRHILAAVSKTKGRLDPRSLSQTGDIAFNNFIASDKQAKNLALNPAEMADVQNAFRAKATELYLDQHKQDVMEQLRRLEVSARFSQSRAGQTASTLGKMLVSFDSELRTLGVTAALIPQLKDRYDSLLTAKAQVINALGNVASEDFESSGQRTIQQLSPLLKPEPQAGNVLAPSGAPGMQPASGAAVAGKRQQITADQAEFLKAKNGFQWWDANKNRYEVK